MKKTTLLCFLAMGSSFTAWAEVGDKITQLDQLNNNKCYTILPQDNGRGTWTTNAADAGFLYSTGKLGVAVDTKATSQQFAFIKSESGKYYAYSIDANKFLAYTSEKGQTVALVSELLSTDVEAAFIASTDATHKDQYPWVVALNGHHVGISNNYTTGIITHYSSTADGGNCISIIEAGDFDPTEALKQINVYEENISYLNDGKKFLSIPEGAVGQYDPALLQALKDVCGDDGVLDMADVTKPEAKKAIEDLRNVASTEAAFSNSKVYKIRNMNESNGFLLSQAEDGKSRIFSSTRKDVNPIENSEYWQVYTVDEYSFLYNLGTKSYARFNDTKNEWELSKTPVFTKVIRNQNKNVATFVIQDQNYLGNLQYLHINNGVGETGVVGWETTADATNFYFIEQSDITADILDGDALTLAFEKEKANNLIQTFVEGKENYIGSYQAQDINDLKALLNKEDVTSSEIKEQMAKVKSGRNMPAEGKYYFIQNTMQFNDGGVKAIYENPDGTNIAWHTTNQGPAELWQLEDNGSGKYYLKSANTGKYLKLGINGAPDPTATMLAEKISAFDLEEKDNSITLGIVCYVEGSQTTLVLQNGNTWGTTAKAENESGDYVGTYNSFTEGIPTKWNIVEANSVKVEISGSQYATLWLPYAVDLNGTNVEAYTIGNIDKDVATLKKIEGSIIPANSAVILRGEAGSYDLPIVANNDQAAIESELTGTSIATTVNGDINAYILGNGDKGIGFYQMAADDRTMAANKAYLILPASAQGVRSIIFSDGETTGIDETVAETATEEYYDLQGRRVMNPTKGIYVTKSGKKVIFNK